VGRQAEWTQHLRQGRRAHFGCSAGAAGQRRQPNLISRLHGIALTSTREHTSYALAAPSSDDRRRQ
jgi:hypothetical protein